MKVWFIGQGFIGWNMANEFEDRWYEVVRYSKNRFPENLPALQECEYVFVWVPTPTKNRKFDDTTLMEAVKNTVSWQKITIKSTVLPGTIDKIQQLYPDRYFFHSAEFLAERSAAEDVANPTRNVVWYTDISKPYAEEVLKLLPSSPHNFIVTARESELGKYMSNVLLTIKLITANMFYDVCKTRGINYNNVKDIAWSDPRIWPSHLSIEFEWGRWAGWHCFVKDLSAFHELYKSHMISPQADQALEFLEQYNMQLLQDTGKSLDIIKEVFGL